MAESDRSQIGDAATLERANAGDDGSIPWFDLIAAVIGFRLLISAVGIGTRLLLPRAHQAGGISGLLLEPWRQFDTLRFIQIASHGYAADGLNTAYLPMYPLLLRIMSFITAGHYLTAGLIVSNIGCAVAIALFWRWVADLYSPRIAWRAVAVLLMFPDAFYLVGAYSESIFLAFTSGALLASQRGRPLLASALATAATMTRIQGLCLVVPLAIDLWRNGSRRSALATGAASLAAPFAAILLYQRILISKLGGSGFVDTFQQKWHITLQPPWQTIRQYVDLIRSPAWHLISSPKANYIMLWDLVIGLVVLAVILASYKTLGLKLTLFGLVSWCVALSRWYSTGRYMLAVLPFFIALAVWADGRRLRRVTTATLILLVFFTSEFAQGNWVD